MKDFKIRCSAIGKIMTNARSKTETLSQTTKTYLEEWYKEQLYGRRKEISTKYMDKGLICEDESIDLITEYYKYGFLVKNEKFFENDYLTGTPDLILKELVIDIKNSWDCFTFPLFETKINKDYYWQLQGYMALTGLKSASLIYTLMDTPINLIEKDAYFHCKSLGYDDIDSDILDQFKDKMTYKDISDNLKIKRYDFDRNDEDIEKIHQRVSECREYLETIKIK